MDAKTLIYSTLVQNLLYSIPLLLLLFPSSPLFHRYQSIYNH